MPVKPLLMLCCALAVLCPLSALARPLQPDDWYRFQALGDLTLAADGSQLAYLVTSFDKKSDASVAALWVADWTHGAPRQLPTGGSVSDPRFSPDGHSVSFLAARPPTARTQLWAMDVHGGTAHALSHVTGEITAYEWAPDGAHVVLVMHAPAGIEACKDPGAEADADSPKPLVIDALQFKQDKLGYLTAESVTHLFLLDVHSGECQALTADPQRQDSAPAFSADGRRLAFVGNRIGGARDIARDELYVMPLSVGAVPRKLLSTYSPNHQQLQWSPDGTLIAFLHGDAPKFNAYITDALAVASVNSDKVRALAESLDRAIIDPQFSADGHGIRFAVEDDGYQYPAEVSLATGAVTRLSDSTVASELVSRGGHTAVLASSDHSPPEVYALEGGKLRRLSHHNDALFAELTLGTVEDLKFHNRSGIEVHGQIIRPADYTAGRRYPTIVWIHGGPNGQDDHSLELWGYGPPLERQLFATHGYVALAINYRGGTGRGAQYARAILGDWGNKEVEDLLAGVDAVVAQGIADPQRLGIGGWSYGGILTDYTIASDTRFKAAISGAGSGNQTAMYGADEYIVEYNSELGPPWKDTALWMKLSYPFFHADRITTPTLFLGGDKDFNVPVAGGEQMYQALRTLGVPSQLIVYPGEYHTLTRPSFLIDRWQRYLAWMDRYLKDAR